MSEAAGARLATGGREITWQERCRGELMKRDPRLVVVFNLRWQQFDGDCTAAQIHRALHAQGFAWAPASRDTTTRWFNEILAAEARHRS